MHSSRMHTLRCSGHMLVEGGVCPGGVCPGVSAKGCLPRGISAQGGVWTRGVCLWSGVPPGGGCLRRGMCVSQHALRQTPPPLWTEFLTHACENITFLQLCCGLSKCVHYKWFSLQLNFLKLSYKSEKKSFLLYVGGRSNRTSSKWDPV